jgi:hypothetical protein
LGANSKILQEALGFLAITLELDIYSYIIPTLQKEAVEGIDRV